jgi:hypothetical protein
MIPRYVYDKPFTFTFPDRGEWKDRFQSIRKGGLIWYTDGSKTNKNTGAGVYGYGIRRKVSFNFGQYITVFQAEVHAIKACTVKNLGRNYRIRNIYIILDSQAAIKATITRSIINWFGTANMQPAKHNRVQMIWMPTKQPIN